MSEDGRICYLNGRHLPLAQATISVMDRGFLFGDGVYEIIPVYAGRPFRLPEHLRRLERSLDEIRLASPLDADAWTAMLEDLVAQNGGGDQALYLQVTRGAAPLRDHLFPAEVQPTVFAMATPLKAAPAAMLERGIQAVTVPDNRWLRCHIKATALLANVLLKQQGKDQGADEVILIRDGMVSEGSASNVFVVKGGTIATPPADNQILRGVTRDLVVELALANGMPCQERPVSLQELQMADEIWISSSTREVIPAVRLDGRAVGSGEAGALWRQMYAHFAAYKAATCGS